MKLIILTTSQNEEDGQPNHASQWYESFLQFSLDSDMFTVVDLATLPDLMSPLLFA